MNWNEIKCAKCGNEYNAHKCPLCGDEEIRKGECVATDPLMDEIARQKVEIESWKRLAFDMLQNFQEGKDFNVTEERVEAWRDWWNKLTGSNIIDYLENNK